MATVNHSFANAARYLLLLGVCWCYLPQASADTREDLARRYHSTNDERTLFQKRTKKYISMDDCYTHCLSQAATEAACIEALQQVTDTMTRLAAQMTPTPVPTFIPQSNIIADQDTTVYIERPFLKTPIPPQPPQQPIDKRPPRNQFTPRPSFTPLNPFQGGDGFNQ